MKDNIFDSRRELQKGETMEEKREGYDFAGWYLDPECTKRINPAASLPSSIRLYPKWVPVTYNVIYNLSEGENSIYNPKTITAESGVLKLFPAKCEGKVFQGWYCDDKKVEYLPEKNAGDIYLEGRFVSLPSVHFETGAPMKIADQICSENGRLKTIPSPLQIGYRFAGWYHDPQFKRILEPGFIFIQDATVYAKWELMEYRIYFDTDGGELLSDFPESYSVLSPSRLLPRAQKPGFRFGGWFDPRGNQVLLLRKGNIGQQNFKARWIPAAKKVCSIPGAASDLEEWQSFE
jgi:uncharacterized repeat protein (TIGR02543 family)